MYRPISGGFGRIFVSGLWLGLGAAAPIGPVNVEIARRAIGRGFWAGFALGCGAVTIDVADAILSSLALRPLVGHRQIMQLIGLGGALFLTWLGIGCLRGLWRHLRRDPLAGVETQTETTVAARRAYLTGLFMTALNPMTLAFWFIVVPSIVGAITDHPSHDLPIICAGVFVATLSWVIAFSGTMARLGRWGNTKLIVIADAAGGIILLAFAAVGFWRLAHLTL